MGLPSTANCTGEPAAAHVPDDPRNGRHPSPRLTLFLGGERRAL